VPWSMNDLPWKFFIVMVAEIFEDLKRPNEKRQSSCLGLDPESPREFLEMACRVADASNQCISVVFARFLLQISFLTRLSCTDILKP